MGLSPPRCWLAVPRSSAEPWQGWQGEGTAAHRMGRPSPAHKVWAGLGVGWAEPQAGRPADRGAQPGVREAGIWLPPLP